MKLDRFDLLVILAFAVNIFLFTYSHYAVASVQNFAAQANQIASNPQVAQNTELLSLGLLFLFGSLFGLLSAFYINIRSQNELRKTFAVILVFIMISYDLIIIFGGAAL